METANTKKPPEKVASSFMSNPENRTPAHPPIPKS